MEAKYCPNCEQIYKPNFSFCVNDGFTLKEVPKCRNNSCFEHGLKGYCPRCGMSFLEDIKETE